MNILATMEQVFRDRQSFFSDVKKGSGLLAKIRDATIVWAVALLLSGAVMGIPGGVYQTIASAIKLPLLFALAAMVTLPVLYFFTLYFRAQLGLQQIAGLLSGMLVITSMLTLAFAPILIVLWATVGDYGLYKLLGGAILALTGVLGVLFLQQGLEKVSRGGLDKPRARLFWLWAAVYALIGGQLAWVMRPFISKPGAAFELFRASGGSLYAEAARTLWNLVLSLIH